MNECADELPAAAQRGIELFNRREFFEAHEALEMAWRGERGPVRDLYRGILQVAVAYLHLSRKNYIGVIKVMTRAFRWLAPLPNRCQGVELERLRSAARAVWAEAERLGPDRLAEFDWALFQPIELFHASKESL